MPEVLRKNTNQGRELNGNIDLCGEGGCGKATIVTLLAKEIASSKSKVLVIDTDESNIGLHSNVKGIREIADMLESKKKARVKAE